MRRERRKFKRGFSRGSEDFLDPKISDEEILTKFSLRNKKNWSVKEVRELLRELKKKGGLERFCVKSLYRPFDVRWLFYHPAVIEGPRFKVMRHMLAGENVGLVCPRRVEIGSWQHAFVTNALLEHVAVSLKTIDYLFPLYLYYDEENTPFKEPLSNLHPDFVGLVAERTGSERTPEEIFYYIYGILYTPSYRKRYAQFLRYDFPRIPVFDGPTFEKIYRLGATLVSLHLMKHPLPKLRARFPVPGDHRVERVEYVESEKKVWINDEEYFEGVEPEAWEYKIGGYQVLKKWLEERKRWKRRLSTEEVEHFRKVHEILLLTIEIQKKLDEAWPLKDPGTPPSPPTPPRIFRRR